MEGSEIGEQGYGLITDIINQNYTDRIDRIESAWAMPDGTIQAIVWDEGRQLIANLGDSIEILMVNESPTLNVQFAEGKKRNCKSGISIACGASCISKSKTCRKEATSEQKDKIKAVIDPKFLKAAKDAKNAPKDKKGIVSDLGKLRSAKALVKADKENGITEIGKARLKKETAKKVTSINKGKLMQGDIIGATRAAIAESEKMTEVAREAKAKLKKSMESAKGKAKAVKDKYPKL